MDRTTRSWAGVLLLIGVVFVGVGLPWSTTSAQQTVTDQMDSVGYEALTVSTTALPFGALASNARAAVCTLEGTAQLRYRYDGTNPTSSEGHLSATPSATAPIPLTILGRNNVIRFRAIRAGGSDATLRCTYLR